LSSLVIGGSKVHSLIAVGVFVLQACGDISDVEADAACAAIRWRSDKLSLAISSKQRVRKVRDNQHFLPRHVILLSLTLMTHNPSSPKFGL